MPLSLRLGALVSGSPTPKEMAASDMNRRHVQPLLTWSTTVAHPTDNYLIILQLNRNGNRCTIQWIKGHSGIVGNDIADTLAKRGAESADPCRLLNRQSTGGRVKHGKADSSL
ncbi:hypothetical protein LAZ67_5003580 [Cordylochernes scorpioides]|uniref:RNase H type-1 domain-containing protein n=1 Tax=Cordylochernes scorpioides TaxID=51811 RepID=A0ABY6KKW1_9ARAC|nr:hypothetical protein LAZ67_5003580 [Cordylochernes scorpioides]